MKVNEITLEEFAQQVADIESKTAEPNAFSKQIMDIASEIYSSTRRNRNFHIFTDYDADGITSAYIIQRLIQSINPKCEVTVTVNDPLNGYGTAGITETKKDADSRYIVLDMGSNDMENIFDKFGQDTIIIDHHIFEDKEAKIAFGRDKPLLNPQSFTCDDGNSPQYCTAGLAYRIYKGTQKILGDKFMTTPMQDNTITAMAAIGTIADCVNVVDVNSHNRQIIKAGIDAINNADEKNFDGVIGLFLSKCGLGKCDVTAKDIGYSVSPVINAGNRMRGTLGYNSAQEVFNVLSTRVPNNVFSDPNADRSVIIEVSRKLDNLIHHNEMRKEMTAKLQADPNYTNTVEAQLESDNAVFVYRLPDDTDTRFAGLIAGKLADATNKAVIVLSYNSETDSFAGSGRNAPSMESSLLEFINSIAPDIPDFEYGGHHDAMGVSSLSTAGYDMLIRKVDAEGKSMQYKDEITRITATIEELNSPETLELMKSLEPFGNGLDSPTIQMECTERGSGKTISGNDNKIHTVRDPEDKNQSLSITCFNNTKNAPMPLPNGKMWTVFEVGIHSYESKTGEIITNLQCLGRMDYAGRETYKELCAKEEPAKKKTDIGKP